MYSQLLSPAITFAGNLVSDSIQDRRDSQSRAWQEKMVNEANAFNSPAAQMNRLKQAGLNPNLVTGNPISSSASAPSPGSGSSPSRYSEVADSLISAMSSLSQISVNQANAELLESETHKTDVESNLLLRGEGRAADEFLYGKSKRPFNDVRDENAESRAQNADKRAENADKRAENADKRSDEERAESKARFEFWQKYAESDHSLDVRSKNDIHKLSYEQYRKAERDAQLIIDTFDSQKDQINNEADISDAELQNLWVELSKNAIFAPYLRRTVSPSGHVEYSIKEGQEQKVLDLIQDINGLNTVGDGFSRKAGSFGRKLRTALKYIK